MRYRQFFHNGKPTDRVDSTEAASFGVSDEVGIAEVAERLGVSVEEVSVEVTNDAPKRAPDVVIPPEAAPEVPPSKLDQLIAAIEAAGSAELKAAVRGLK